MLTKQIALDISILGLICLLVAGVTVSVADDAPRPPGPANSIPNMICTPVSPEQSQMPPNQWTDCVGTYTFNNGNFYRGEFHNGARDGFGVLAIKYTGPSSDTEIGWDGPAIYVGSFKDGRLNGYGLLIPNSGAAYAGTFKDNIPQPGLVQKQCSGDVSAEWTNCIGTYRFPNRNVYRGEFVRGLPEGIGILDVNAVKSPEDTQMGLPSPGVYVGQFRAGKFNGQGAVVMSGVGYFGTFDDDTFVQATADDPVVTAGPRR